MAGLGFGSAEPHAYAWGRTRGASVVLARDLADPRGLWGPPYATVVSKLLGSYFSFGVEIFTPEKPTLPMCATVVSQENQFLS